MPLAYPATPAPCQSPAALEPGPPMLTLHGRLLQQPCHRGRGVDHRLLRRTSNDSPKPARQLVQNESKAALPLRTRLERTNKSAENTATTMALRSALHSVNWRPPLR